MKILITGSNGFIGKNLVSQLTTQKGIEILCFTRESAKNDLQQAVSQVDFICHLAGVNRPSDAKEFERVNTDLTKTLCQEVQRSGRHIPIIFTSSVHAEKNTPYGVSKFAAEQLLLRLSEETGSPIYIFRLSHVFGKWCRPNYNSAIATFCHNIARNLPIQIDDPDYQLKLVYIDDLVSAFSRAIAGEENGGPYCEMQPTYPISVGELANKIRAFRASRGSLVSERVGTGLTRALYATYISYLPPQDFTYEVPKHADPRGVFVEMLKTEDSGQFSFLTAHPGITRGSHYHHSKTEKFMVIRGNARFRFRNILTQEFHEVLTSGEKPVIVDSAPGWTHDITNVGKDEMILMVWANEIFDHNHPDTYACPV